MKINRKENTLSLKDLGSSAVEEITYDGSLSIKWCGGRVYQYDVPQEKVDAMLKEAENKDFSFGKWANGIKKNHKVLA